MEKLRVVVWNEGRHEKSDAAIKSVYPDGIHGAIVSALNRDGSIAASGATLDEPEHGLAQRRLDQTDVLIWWGHQAPDAVSDEIVNRVYGRVLAGMRLIVLHSAHFSMDRYLQNEVGHRAFRRTEYIKLPNIRMV